MKRLSCQQVRAAGASGAALGVALFAAAALLVPLGVARAQPIGLPPNTPELPADMPPLPTMHTLMPGDALPALTRGDVLVLLPGTHVGPWTIDVPDVTMLAGGAVLDGGGVGSALTLLAPGIHVEGLTVTNVGQVGDLYEPDAAIAAFDCHQCVIRGLVAEGVTSGLRVEGSDDVHASGLRLRGDGRRTAPGVTAYLAPRMHVSGATVDGFLDGIYYERSDRAVVLDSRLTGSARYGLHAMLSIGLTFADNVVQGDGLGSVVMYGRGSTIIGNRFEGHREAMAFGLLLQEETLTRVVDNDVAGNSIGVMIVAAPNVRIEHNRFDANGVAVLVQRPEVETDTVTALRIEANAFTRNAADVAVDDELAALTLLGNAFDRAPLLDLDGDGIVDVPYVATSAFAARAARQPDLTLLAHGPGIALWARLEASVPGVRGATFADPEARRVAPHQRAPGAGTGGAVLAAGLVVTGLALASSGSAVVARTRASGRRQAARPTPIGRSS